MEMQDQEEFKTFNFGIEDSRHKRMQLDDEDWNHDYS